MTKLNIDPLEQAFSVPGHYEPSFSYTILKACAKCGGVHPLARTPPQPDGTCPDCGAPTKKSKEKSVRPQLGIATHLSNFMKTLNKHIKGEKD